MTIAIIVFPGTNCEQETKRAIESVGMKAELIRWNTKKDLSSYDGFVLPGGWSYEDRIRAGVIASKDPVTQQIKREAAKGKPVLGICNGAQVLLELNLVPGINYVLDMALAPNTNPKISGYYCTWTYVKINNPCAFLQKKDHVFAIPIAHGEGRFTTKSTEIRNALNRHVVLQYCTKEGEVSDTFPTNPNGSMLNIAGLCNKEGNVLALMPHPERSNWLFQVPQSMGNRHKTDAPGPARLIFENMKNYIEARR